MASDRSYLDYIMDQLSGLEGVSYRAMMGEYIIYVDGKVVGGIYDNRFLIKPVQAAVRLLPDASREIPYPGAKEMILMPDPDNSELLKELLRAVSAELPEPRKRK